MENVLARLPHRGVIARRTIAAQRAARWLRPAARFLALEARPGALGRYEVRGTGRAVHLRHGSRDVEIFNEIFGPGRESYEPPPEVAATLASLGPLRVGDLGANIGLFGVFALGRWPVSAMRSYEPDPANAALLGATIAANDLAARWELVPVAVSNAETTATFETGLLSESRLCDPRGTLHRHCACRLRCRQRCAYRHRADYRGTRRGPVCPAPRRPAQDRHRGRGVGDPRRCPSRLISRACDRSGVAQPHVSRARCAGRRARVLSKRRATRRSRPTMGSRPARAGSTASCGDCGAEPLFAEDRGAMCRASFYVGTAALSLCSRRTAAPCVARASMWGLRR